MSTIKSSDEHLTLNADGSSKDIKFQANGVEKASIDSSGNLTVSGSVTADGLTVDGLAQLNGDLTIYDATGDPFIKLQTDEIQYVLRVDNSASDIFQLRDATNSANRIGVSTGGDISFYEDTGTTPKFFWDSSAEKLGIGLTAPLATLDLYKSADTAERAIRFGNDTGSAFVGVEGSSGNRFSGSAVNNVFLGATSALGLEFATSNVVRMNIDTSGNVGIGVTPESWHSAWTVLQLGATGFVGQYQGGGSDITGLGSNVYSDGTYKYIETDQAAIIRLSDGSIIFSVAPSGTADAAISWTTALTIDNTGNILSQYGSITGYAQTSGNGGIAYNNDDGSAGGALVLANDADNGWSNIYINKFEWSSGKDDRFMQFAMNGTSVGYIRGTTSSTSFITSSDYRLKENVDYTCDATTRLKQLKPARFNFIADDTNTLVDGFIAHEVSSVVPEAISGTKDAMKDEEYEVTPAVEEVRDEEGNITTEAVEAVMGTRSVPDMQGIDQSKLVPLLVKTIQELEARITALES